ncbi:LPS-assembly protein LptD [Pseudooceanicola aestuarii]|uniref:LPS-assembly protein LptD n=1 Tax=Pseudooceanicola aestuarii TaxID=2697319 RepID=UPI0013CFDAB1|nr:LPS assembly protein LptD [Pseudooceanicola aestuarii]
MRGLLLVILAALLPGLARAQQAASGAETVPAMLIADRVFLEGRDRVVAEGAVEALQDGTRLTATRIIYDQNRDLLTIEGPITLIEGPDQVILADSGEIDAELRNGLLIGARAVLNQQLQLAAYQLNRVNGDTSQFYKATVSSCKVCGNGPPLWQFRARRIVHDEEARQLYLDDARFEVMGLPILYLPRLRMPDPSQDRATGFLMPAIKRNSLLGTGVKLPYFIAIDPQRDLTLTPYVAQNTKTLEFTYRHAFATGRLAIAGAVSSDTLRPGDPRGYLEAVGRFALPRDFILAFDVELVGDDAYLSNYGYSDKDRLDSEARVFRVARDEYIAGSVTYFHTLRTTEDNATIPSLIGDFDYERRFFPAKLGGEVRLGADVHSHYRYSDLAYDSTDSDSVTDGRDVTRLTFNADWRRSFTLPAGLRAELFTGVEATAFRTAQDLALPVSEAGISPTAAVTLRWPWVRAGAGARHVIEPVAQVAWTGGDDLDVANDESTRIDFDEGNLLSLSRFTADDRVERGLRGAFGLSWSRFDPEGWSSRLVLGTVLRDDADDDFTVSSGLRGTTSDLLIAGQLRTAQGLVLTARGLFDNRMEATKAEARANFNWRNAAFGASYVWLDADADEDRAAVVSEWTLDGSFPIVRHWSGSVNFRYDVASNDAVSAGLGLAYQNECLDVSLSLSRNFTSSTIVTPSTDFAFLVGLRGFSAQTADSKIARTCRN